ALPHARLFVCDNTSRDGTAQRAREAGAIVLVEKALGKGNAVRRLFADIEADAYLLVDGDDTYDPAIATEMVRRLFDDGLDMVVAARRNVYAEAHRSGHGFGNRLFNRFYQSLFGNQFTDIFSGYRVFSRRFVKSFPALSQGFAVETELAVHAGQLQAPVAEIEGQYRARPPGSESKLNTWHDAARILGMMLLLMKETHPARLFGLLAVALASTAIGLAIPILQTFMETGLVPRFPTAILASALMLLASIALTCGLILDSVARGRLEARRRAYLAHPGPRAY
ncbi:MAG: hypothetical protein RIS35_2180, partial [Pseudomonadota bacterium]